MFDKETDGLEVRCGVVVTGLTSEGSIKYNRVRVDYSRPHTLHSITQNSIFEIRHPKPLRCVFGFGFHVFWFLVWGVLSFGVRQRGSCGPPYSLQESLAHKNQPPP